MRKAIMFMISLTFLLSSFAQTVEAEKQDFKKNQERIEFLTMWKMMEALDLDKPTAEKILNIRKQFLSQRQALQTSLQDDFQNLRTTLRDTPRGREDEKGLSSILNQIREKRKKLEAMDDELYNQISQVLTVRQQAELILFLKDFRKEMRSLLRPPPPHGPGPGGPPFDSDVGPGDHETGPRFPKGGLPERPGGAGPPRKLQNLEGRY